MNANKLTEQYVITQDTLAKLKFPNLNLGGKIKIKFNQSLEMTQDLRDSLILGIVEYVTGRTYLEGKSNKIFCPPNGEYLDLQIPTNYGMRGGRFSVECNMATRTYTITGYISFGSFEQNAKPVNIFDMGGNFERNVSAGVYIDNGNKVDCSWRNSCRP